MAVWCVAMIMGTDSTSLTYTPEVKSFVIGAVLGMGCLVPLLFWALLTYFGLLQRRGSGVGLRGGASFVMLVAALCLFGCGRVLAGFGLLFVVRKVLYTLALVAIVEAIMEYIWPLSCYTSTMGAVLGIFWILLFVGNVALLYHFIVGIVALGLLCSARVYLSGSYKSVWREAIGAVVGFAMGATMFILL